MRIYRANTLQKTQNFTFRRIRNSQQLREIKLMDNEMTRPKHQFSNKLRHGCKKNRFHH